MNRTLDWPWWFTRIINVRSITFIGQKMARASMLDAYDHSKDQAMHANMFIKHEETHDQPDQPCWFSLAADELDRHNKKNVWIHSVSVQRQKFSDPSEKTHVNGGKGHQRRWPHRCPTAGGVLNSAGLDDSRCISFFSAFRSIHGNCFSTFQPYIRSLRGKKKSASSWPHWAAPHLEHWINQEKCKKEANCSLQTWANIVDQPTPYGNTLKNC